MNVEFAFADWWSLVTSKTEHTAQYQPRFLPLIPDDELWLYRDSSALASVVRGIEEAREGKGRVLSFAQHANEE
jgi:hypothetical protein